MALCTTKTGCRSFTESATTPKYSAKEIIQFQRWHTDLRMLVQTWPSTSGHRRASARCTTCAMLPTPTYAKANLPAKDQYQTAGIGAALALDTRDNNIFPYKGYYISVSNYDHSEWASQHRSLSSLEFDYRHFFNPRKGKHVLVIRAYASATFGEVPFRLNSHTMAGIHRQGILRRPLHRPPPVAGANGVAIPHSVAFTGCVVRLQRGFCVQSPVRPHPLRHQVGSRHRHPLCAQQQRAQLIRLDYGPRPQQTR